jgi:hypothetical protein
MPWIPSAGGELRRTHRHVVATSAREHPPAWHPNAHDFASVAARTAVTHGLQGWSAGYMTKPPKELDIRHLTGTRPWINFGAGYH